MDRKINVGKEEIYKVGTVGRAIIIDAKNETITVEKGVKLTFIVDWAYEEASKKKEEYYFLLEVFDENGNLIEKDEELIQDGYSIFNQGSGKLLVNIDCPQHEGRYSYRCHLKCEYRHGEWEKSLKKGQHGSIIDPSEYKGKDSKEKDVTVLLIVIDAPSYVVTDTEYKIAEMYSNPDRVEVVTFPVTPIFTRASTPLTITLSAKYKYNERGPLTGQDWSKNDWDFYLRLYDSDGNIIKYQKKAQNKHKHIKETPGDCKTGNGKLKVFFKTLDKEGAYVYLCKLKAQFWSAGWLLPWKSPTEDSDEVKIQVHVMPEDC